MRTRTYRSRRWARCYPMTISEKRARTRAFDTAKSRRPSVTSMVDRIQAHESAHAQRASSASAWLGARVSHRHASVRLLASFTSAAVFAAGMAFVTAPTAAALAGSLPFYRPCSTIAWAYDASAQPVSASSMVVDTRAALAMVSRQTGITFQEVPFGVAADLVFDWSALADHEPGTQAVGWRSGVTFATGAEMAGDEWSGFGRKAVRRSGGSFDVGIGRGWIVVHEVMHSLGLPHSDEPGSVMSPVAEITNVLGRARARGEQQSLPRPGFSEGDLAALESMYPRAGCPTQP
ncbi:MAG: matrixin family metalloprotease [Actinobacteria bacterium]|nr:matrixin family metalloprotease [Actinomycetota bacterium]